MKPGDFIYNKYVGLCIICNMYYDDFLKENYFTLLVFRESEFKLSPFVIPQTPVYINKNYERFEILKRSVNVVNKCFELKKTYEGSFSKDS